MKYKLLLFTLFCAFFSSPQNYAQNYKFHSVFIYNFTKYIQWPSSYQNGNFVIAVLGKSEVTDNLIKMSAVKTVGTQKIEVKEINDNSLASKCHILFIPNNKSNTIDEVLAAFSSKPTLIITEKVGLAKKGSGINFVLQGGKWRFELNKTALETSNLKVSGELSKLAIVI